MWLVNICTAYPYPHRIQEGIRHAEKGPRLNWTEDIQLYEHFTAWRKRVEKLTTSITEKKELKISSLTA